MIINMISGGGSQSNKNISKFTITNKNDLNIRDGDKNVLVKFLYENKSPEDSKQAILTYFLNGQSREQVLLVDEDNGELEFPLDLPDTLEENHHYQLRFNIIDSHGNTRTRTATLGFNINHNYDVITEFIDGSFHITGMKEGTEKDNTIIKVGSHIIRDNEGEEQYGLYPITHVQYGAFNDSINDGKEYDDDNYTGKDGYGNNEVEQIWLPDTINFIDFRAFMGFEKLQRIIVTSPTPPRTRNIEAVDGATFNKGEQYNGIQVPDELYEIYKQAWGGQLGPFLSKI